MQENFPLMTLGLNCISIIDIKCGSAVSHFVEAISESSAADFVQDSALHTFCSFKNGIENVSLELETDFLEYFPYLCPAAGLLKVILAESQS